MADSIIASTAHAAQWLAWFHSWDRRVESIAWWNSRSSVADAEKYVVAWWCIANSANCVIRAAVDTACWRAGNSQSWNHIRTYAIRKLACKKALVCMKIIGARFAARLANCIVNQAASAVSYLAWPHQHVGIVWPISYWKHWCCQAFVVRCIESCQVVGSRTESADGRRPRQAHVDVDVIHLHVKCCWR